MRANANLSFLAPEQNTPDLPPDIAEEIGRLVAERHAERALLTVYLQIGQLNIWFEPYRQCSYLAPIFQTRDQYVETMQQAFVATFNWLKGSEELYKKYPRLPEPRTDLSGKKVNIEDVQQKIQATADIVMNARLKISEFFSDAESRQHRDSIDRLTLKADVALPLDVVLNIFAGERMWGTWMHKLLNLPKDEREKYLEENVLLIFMICLHYGEVNIPRYLMSLSPHLASHAEILPMIISDLTSFAHHMERTIQKTNHYLALRETTKQEMVATLAKHLPNDPAARDFLLNTPGEDLQNLSWLPKNQTLEEYYEQRINGFKAMVELAVKHGPNIDQTFIHNKQETTPRKELAEIGMRLLKIVNTCEIPENRQAQLNAVFAIMAENPELAPKRMCI